MRSLLVVLILSPLLSQAQINELPNIANIMQGLNQAVDVMGQNTDLWERVGETFHSLTAEYAEDGLRMVHEYTHNPAFKTFLENRIEDFKVVSGFAIKYLEDIKSDDLPIELTLAKTYITSKSRAALKSINADCTIDTSNDALSKAVRAFYRRLKPRSEL